MPAGLGGQGAAPQPWKQHQDLIPSCVRSPTTGLLEGPLSTASPGKNASAPTVWRARAGAPFGGFILPPEVRAKGALSVRAAWPLLAA